MPCPLRRSGRGPAGYEDGATFAQKPPSALASAGGAPFIVLALGTAILLRVYLTTGTGFLVRAG
jgi:hypothetical protein